MINYIFQDDTILDSVRSLVCFYGYYRLCKDRYEVCRKSPSLYFLSIASNSPIVLHYVEDNSGYNQFIKILSKYNLDDFMNACKYVHNLYMRTTRIRQRIDYILSNYPKAYFITLTIDDENLLLPYDKILKVVKETFSLSSSCYVFNPDFSPEKNRLHFHGVCTLDKLDDFEKLPYFLGFYKIQLISFADDSDSFSSDLKLSKYLTKLAKHSTKHGTLKATFSRLR